MSDKGTKTPLSGLFESTQTDHERRILNHLFEESAALNVYDKSIINLAAGCPGPDLLGPLTTMFNRAVKHRMEQEEQEKNFFLFQYGPTAGWSGMRRRLSEFLTKQYGDSVDEESLVLTCGATHGLHLTISTILAPNGIVFVDEYTYMIALHLFKEFPHLEIHCVPMESDGVNIEQLSKLASTVKTRSKWEVSEAKPFWAIYYTIPTFHNPTGVLLSPAKCSSLVRIARDLDFLIVCDDVYNLLYYTGEPKPPARLFSYDSPKSADYKGGHVVSNGSFSKILAPGVRVGWMEMPTKLTTRFRQSGILQSGGSVNNVMFGIIESLIELGLAEEHLNWYRTVYQERMSVFCKALRTYLPDECSFAEPAGGYFVWVKVPCDGGEFLKWCSQNGGPNAVPSIRFSLNSLSTTYSKDADKSNDNVAKASSSTRSPAIRLSIGFHDAETLKAAAKTFGEKLAEYINLTKQMAS